MNKEINEMEREIEANKTYSDELKRLKNSKLKLKALNALKYFHPYILLAGLISLTCLAAAKRAHKACFVSEKTIDSFGNEKSISEYSTEDVENTTNISYFGKWELNNNGEYERTVKKYSIENINYEAVKSIISNDSSINSLDEIFGDPFYVKKEKGVNLSEEEISKEEYVEAVTYFKDENEYVYNEFSIADKAQVVAAIAFGTSITLGLYFNVHSSFSKYSFLSENTEINWRYKKDLNKLYYEDKTKKLKK